MRKIGCLLLAIAITRPAFAAKKMTVGEFGQSLVKLQVKSDWDAFNELSDLELTERASSAKLAEWEGKLRGKLSREALVALADASAFLKLPADEVILDPAPASAEQQEIMSRANEHVQALAGLWPNFYATLEITHFEDTMPQVQTQPPVGGGRGIGGITPIDPAASYEALHSTSKFSAIISLRDGSQVTETPNGKKAQADPLGLNTSGEFGPILNVVMSDAGRGTVSWDHWEMGPAGKLAVFRYKVPAVESHFSVVVPLDLRSVTLTPDYHGEIAVDPASGEIYRVTEVADPKSPWEKGQAEVLVEYAPVLLGDHTYVCPVHGVAILKTPVDSRTRKPGFPPVQTYLNDEVFSDYHLFRAETHILPQ